MTFDKILVPVDFSEHSSEALRFAIDVAKRYGASLHIVHVFQPLMYIAPEGYIIQSAEQLSELIAKLGELLATEKNKAKQALDRVDVELLQGVPATEIVAYARDKSCSLIVMGTHGRTGIKHAVMGSVAERVVRTAPCPVLTTPLRKRG